jgi:AsmA protein
MKILKYTLFALGGLIVVIGAVLAYVAATFDPNQYKPQVIAAVKEKTQRTLRLDGDIELSFWPSIGAKIGKAALSERAADREFAAVEEAHVSLKLMPLLSGQAIADKVILKGLRANIVKMKDGKTNVDDLTGPPAPKEAPAPREAEPLRVDIAGVEIQNASIQYTDLAAGTKYALSNLDLKAGRIAPGVPTRVELSVHARSDQPKVDLKAALKTRLVFEPGQALNLDELDLDAKGMAAGLTNLALKATGAVMANAPKGEFTANKLNVSLKGMSGKDTLDVRAEVPRLHLAGEKAAGDKVSIVARITGPDGVTQAALTLPGIEGSAQAFRSAAAHLDLDLKRGDISIKAKVTSPLAGNAKTQQLSLPQLRANINATGPHIPGKSVTGDLAGSASIDGSKQNARANLAGKVGDSQIKAQFGVTDFTPVALTFNVDIDQLDADRYLPPKPAGGAGEPAAAGGKKAPEGKGVPAGAASPEQPFDLAGLRNLRANGKIHVGSLKLNNIKVSNIRADVNASDGRVNLSPVTANLYQGTLSSAVAINAAPATPTFAVKHSMTGINIGPLLQDAASNDTLEGKGNVSLDVTSQGNTVDALKRALNGRAAVKLADGAIKGIDIAGTLRSAKARLGQFKGEQVQAADKTQKTDFSELTATLQFKNGVARNDDLSIKSPLLRGDGAGNINIGDGTLDYLVKASIVGTTKGQGGRDVDELRGITVPVRVSGAIAAPSYKLDFSTMVTDSAKQRIADELEKRLLGGGRQQDDAAKKEGTTKEGTKPGGSTRDVLRGILGR